MVQVRNFEVGPPELAGGDATGAGVARGYTMQATQAPARTRWTASRGPEGHHLIGVN